MAEITCPKCHATFTISEEEYKSIRAQLRDQEFIAALHEREQAFEQSKQDAVKIAEAEFVAKVQSKLAEKDAKLAELTAQLKAAEVAKSAAVNELVAQKETEIAKLNAQIQANKTEQDLAVQKAVAEKSEELNQKTIEIAQLKGQMESNAKEAEIAQNNLKASYEQQLELKDEQIGQLKDFKAKQSTKMVGESLEVYCKNEFDKMRPVGFQNATFEKDNKVSKTGSKGDFIFREAEDGVEFVSIMFEMKNEADDTQVKHKNKEFFKELDKDRKEKNCEYAVLVSTLESDNDYYNTGIVDVSHEYEKMYVVRPQFFIPIITLLRNAAKNSLQYKKDLILAQSQSIDITDFEESLVECKDKINKDYRLAHTHIEEAVKEIDNSIKKMEKVKEELLKTDTHMRLADSKMQEVTIKKLVKGNPTMAAKFEELKKGQNSEDEKDTEE